MLNKIIFILFFALSFSQVNAQNTISKDTSDVSYVVDLERDAAYFDSLNLYINPPKYFKKIDSLFFGFIHVGANASMVLVKAEPLLLAVVPFYDSLSFIQNNETLILKDTLVLNNKQLGFMFVVSFEFQDVLVERILFVTGDSTESVVVSATYPQSIHPILYPIFIESIKTLKLE